MLAVIGLLYCSGRYERTLAIYFWAVCAVFFYVISACCVNWDGNFFLREIASSFSLGPAFYSRLGAYAPMDSLLRGWTSERKSFITAALVVGLFAVWNIAFIFQWGDHMIPVRGTISWRAMVYNQFCVVPVKVLDTAEAFLFHRNRLLHQIEQKDLNELHDPSRRTSHP